MVEAKLEAGRGGGGRWDVEIDKVDIFLMNADTRRLGLKGSRRVRR